MGNPIEAIEAINPIRPFDEPKFYHGLCDSPSFAEIAYPLILAGCLRQLGYYHYAIKTTEYLSTVLHNLQMSMGFSNDKTSAHRDVDKHEEELSNAFKWFEGYVKLEEAKCCLQDGQLIKAGKAFEDARACFEGTRPKYYNGINDWARVAMRYHTRIGQIGKAFICAWEQGAISSSE